MKMKKYPDTEKWCHRRFSGWHQDTVGWTNPDTHEYFPPTYAWFATLSASRRHPRPNGENFYVRIFVSGQKNQLLDERIANLERERGILELDTYADCPCIVGKNCARHQYAARGAATCPREERTS